MCIGVGHITGIAAVDEPRGSNNRELLITAENGSIHQQVKFAEVAMNEA